MASPGTVPYQSLVDTSPSQGYVPPTEPQTRSNGPPSGDPIRLSFWADLMRSKPQKNALNAASSAFITAGMSIAFSIGFSRPEMTLRDHMHVSWFIAAIIGSFLGLYMAQRIGNRLINFLTIFLVAVNGVCFTSAPKEPAALVVGLYCSGLAFGIALPAFIVAAPEISIKRFRAMTLSSEPVSLAVGIFFEVFFALILKDAEQAGRAHGIFVLVHATLGLLSNLICTVESPVYHLRKGNEAEAINALHSLTRREIGPNEVLDLLAEHKKLLEEDAARGMRENFISGLKLYPKIAGLLILSSLSLSAPIVGGFLATGILDLAQNNLQFIYFFMLMRLLGALCGTLMLDTVGRRSLTAFSLFAGSVLLIVFGAMFSVEASVLNIDKMHQAQLVITVFQLFAGIVLTASISYLGEGFSVSVKPYFVVASVCLECIVQIITLFTFELDSLSGFLYTIGAFQMLFAVYFFVTTPETKDTHLREALSELSRTGIMHLS